MIRTWADSDAHGCPSTKWQSRPGDYVRGIDHTVVLRGRDDLFGPETGPELVADDGTKLPGMQVFTRNEITAIPDNVGCCEVISVGNQVQNVKPGDVALIDFCDVRQGAIVGDPETLKGREVYIANDDAFKALFYPDSGDVVPLPGFALTKRASERFAIALHGTDRVAVPPMVLTTGIVSGRHPTAGTPYAYVIYEEVVSVGAPACVSKTRPMTRIERRLLDCLAYPYHGQDIEGLIEQLRAERTAPRGLDVHPKDLVAFSTDFATQIRVRGEFMRLVHQEALLCVIDDAQILEDAIKAGKAGKLVR